MMVLLVAGIVVILAGLLAIGSGIPVKEFGFGNTLILTGTIGACTGLIMLSLAMVVRELQAVARRFAAAEPASAPKPRRDLQLPAAAQAASGEDEAHPMDEEMDQTEPAPDGPLFSRDQPSRTRSPAAAHSGSQPASSPPSQPPWQDEALRVRARNSGAAPVPVEELEPEPEPEVKPRRNLLFSSSSRRERERAAAQDAPVAAEPEAAAPAPKTFEDAWPQSERPRAEMPRRSPRTPSIFSETAPVVAAPAPPVAAPLPAAAPVTVLKSGVVDGMAYSLYSDGSIEAQMPEGMMRFVSIDELREHLDHRV